MKATACKRSNPPAPRLVREEWDFRARPEKAKKTGDWNGVRRFDFLPDDEVALCWLYEFTRTSREVAGYLEWRDGADDPSDFDCLLAHYWRTDPNGKQGCAPVSLWYYSIWPDWPEKPFLSIPCRERQERYRKMWASNPKRQLRLVPIQEIYNFVVAVKAGQNPNLPIDHANSTHIQMEPDVFILQSAIPRQDAVPREIAAFEIDYNLGDKILVRRFQNWLVRRRKEKGYARQQNKGNSRTKLDRADLCALGAYRLLKLGFSIKEAQDYTEKLSGKALFADPGDWSRAKKTAYEAIMQAC